MKKEFSITIILTLLVILNRVTEGQVLSPYVRFDAEKSIISFKSQTNFGDRDTSLIKYEAGLRSLRSSVESNQIWDSSIVERWDSPTQSYLDKQTALIYQTGSNTLVVYNRYLWDWNSGSWHLQNKNEIYTNEYQKVIVNCHLDTDKKQWVGDWKRVTTSDKNGLTGTYDYRWNAESRIWFPERKYEVTYDQDKITYIDSWWDKKINQFVILEKIEDTYDINKNEILRIDYSWDVNDNEWVPRSKTEHSWDALGRNTLYLYSSWYKYSKRWVDVFKTETSYNSNTKTALQFLWNGEWIINYKVESEYDSNRLIHETSYSWDNSANGWKYNSKNDYAYDINGYRTLLDLYTWDNSSGRWVNNMKIENTNDSRGNITLEIRTRPDYITGEVIGERMFDAVYDTYGNQLSYNVYNWDWSTSQFVLYEKGTSYYSEHASVSEIPGYIKVYPNPASEYIIFDIIDISDSAVAEIFDYQGKKVMEQKLPFPSEIYVNNLPRGLYVYRVKSNGKVHTGKIILQ